MVERMRRRRRIVERLQRQPFLIGRLQLPGEAVRIKSRDFFVALQLRINRFHEHFRVQALDLLGFEVLHESFSLKFVGLCSESVALPIPTRALVGTPRRRKRREGHEDGRGPVQTTAFLVRVQRWNRRWTRD